MDSLQSVHRSGKHIIMCINKVALPQKTLYISVQRSGPFQADWLSNDSWPGTCMRVPVHRSYKPADKNTMRTF